MAKGRKSKFNIDEQKFKNVINDLESNGTYPNQYRLYLAVERSVFGMSQGIKAHNVPAFVKKFGIILKTLPSKKGRKPGPKKTEEKTEENTKVNLVETPTEVVVKEKSTRPSGSVSLRKLDIENDKETSKKYAEALKVNGRVIYIYNGQCPIPLRNKKCVDIWVKSLMDWGVNQPSPILFYPTAIYYFVTQFYPGYTKEYQEIRNKVAEYFVNYGLQEFVV